MAGFSGRIFFAAPGSWCRQKITTGCGHFAMTRAWLSSTAGPNPSDSLLPAYDEYLIGYKSRDIVLHPDKAHHAHNNFGIFKSVVAWNGEIVGNWKPSSKDGGVSLFKEGVSIPEESMEKAINTYTQYAHF